jgi:hypothetical protein
MSEPIKTAKTWRIGERYLDHFSLTINEESKYADIRTTRNGYGAMSANLDRLKAIRRVVNLAIAELEATE